MNRHRRRRGERRAAAGVLASAILFAGCAGRPVGTSPTPFRVEEATIAQIHEAMLARRVTARQLVEQYLARIEAYDRSGPSLNAITVVHPRALAVADSLDAVLSRTGRLSGPLHGIPVIVKDNYDTYDLPVTAGSASLAGLIAEDDAFQVRRLREAGAIVLAKSNMAEFAFSPNETVGSAHAGYTLNPYALNRTTAGSSGGTAAAVTASFGAVGLGTDTGNSIRGPSAFASLVGIRSTMGLTSRDGIAPLYIDRDIGGPMARSVADAVAVLDVIAGYDPADSVTARGRDRARVRYAAHLKGDGLAGVRVGVMRQMSNAPTADTAVVRTFNAALEAIRRAGGTVVDSIILPEMQGDSTQAVFCPRFKTDFEAYLAMHGARAPVKTLDSIIANGRFHPSVYRSLQSLNEAAPPATNPRCHLAARNAERLRTGLRRAFAEHRLSAVVYPTWSNPPRRIGDLGTPSGNNAFWLSPPTGFPAITVPMGYVYNGLPVGLELLGDAWSEPALIEIAYAFEQATRHRRPPSSVPPLPR